ncbi:ABC transporter ATP-binding protein [Candidatus Micrarchaeota archaeon]|nr:ABC transporter ATP-binding protein [Candidatus Micrarchaeota archaeon]
MKRKIIGLHNVRKVYSMGEAEVAALDGINLHVNEGEFISVVGPSGSGKSTMMCMIGCLDNPSHGSIYLDGRDISKMSESTLAQIRGRKIGFIFQKFNLIAALSALENVVLPTVFQGLDADEANSRGVEKLALVGLEDFTVQTTEQLGESFNNILGVVQAIVVGIAAISLLVGGIGK